MNSYWCNWHRLGGWESSYWNFNFFALCYGPPYFTSYIEYFISTGAYSHLPQWLVWHSTL